MCSDLRIAVIPGSFDPITKGHLSIVERALKSYDKVYLAVMINPTKQYLFTMEQRTAIAIEALRPYDRVEVISSEGMLWQLAKELGACAIVKGYRNQTDYDYEMVQAKWNLEHGGYETELLVADPKLGYVSSTIAREKIKKGEDLSKILPQKVIEFIANR
jgi:pantetheine-phosphate adenylyltransferase